MDETEKAKIDILIIGAGASGLMACARTSKRRKESDILEARNRIGGRIWPLPEKRFRLSRASWRRVCAR